MPFPNVSLNPFRVLHITSSDPYEAQQCKPCYTLCVDEPTEALRGEVTPQSLDSGVVRRMGCPGSPPGSGTGELCDHGGLWYCVGSAPHPGIQ